MTTATTTTFEADVCFGSNETVEDAARELIDGRPVTFEVLVEHGPGGGWPIVRFTGAAEDIEFVRGAYDS